MNREELLAITDDVADKGMRYSAILIRDHDLEQRQALARVEAERDVFKAENAELAGSIELEDASNHYREQQLKAQLAEAVGLLRIECMALVESIGLINQVVVSGELERTSPTLHAKLESCIAYNAQSDEQEARPCPDCKGTGNPLDPVEHGDDYGYCDSCGATGRAEQEAPKRGKPDWISHGYDQIFQTSDGNWFGARAGWDFKGHISDQWKGREVSLLRDDGGFLAYGEPNPDWESSLEQRPAREAQGAHAADERAAFQKWFNDYSLSVRMNGGMMNDAQMFDAWQARAALATQPAAGEPVAYISAAAAEAVRAGRNAAACLFVPPIPEAHNGVPIFLAPPAAAPAAAGEPKGWRLVPIEPLLGMMSDKDHDTRIDSERTLLAMLDKAPPAATHGDAGDYGDPYQGAREDLAIWKRRALEAEAILRAQPAAHGGSTDSVKEEIRALLEEAHGFAAVSPRGQNNINAALDLLDKLAAHGDEEAACSHRLADARNKHIVSGYFCVDCGAAFAAADHAAMRAQVDEVTHD